MSDEPKQPFYNVSPIDPVWMVLLSAVMEEHNITSIVFSMPFLEKASTDSGKVLVIQEVGDNMVLHRIPPNEVEEHLDNTPPPGGVH